MWSDAGRNVAVIGVSPWPKSCTNTGPKVSIARPNSAGANGAPPYTM